MAYKSPKPIFARPYGASESEHSFCPSGHYGQILCELCGTTLPDQGEDYSYTFGTIVIGGKEYQYVEECCGKFVEDFYKQFGASFTEAFLEDFAENPSASEFGLLRHVLPDVLARARKKEQEILNGITEAQEAFSQKNHP